MAPKSTTPLKPNDRISEGDMTAVMGVKKMNRWIDSTILWSFVAGIAYFILSPIPLHVWGEVVTSFLKHAFVTISLGIF